MEKMIYRETLLGYPSFHKRFEIHNNVSKVQIGAVISQNNKPIAFIVESYILYRLIIQ